MNKFVNVGGVIFLVDEDRKPIYSYQTEGFTITRLKLYEDVSTFILPTIKNIDFSTHPLIIEQLCQCLLKHYEKGEPHNEGIVADFICKYVDGEVKIGENVFAGLKNIEVVVPNTNSYRFLSGAFRDVESVNLKVEKPSRIFDLKRQELKGTLKSLLVANPVIYSAPVEDAMQSRMLVYSLRPQEPIFQDTDIKADFSFSYVDECEIK